MKTSKKIPIIMLMISFFNLRAVSLEEDKNIDKALTEIIDTGESRNFSLRWFVFNNKNLVTYQHLAEERALGEKKEKDGKYVLSIKNKIQRMCAERVFGKGIEKIDALRDSFDAMVLPKAILSGNDDLAAYLINAGFDPNSAIEHLRNDLAQFQHLKDNDGKVTALAAAVGQKNKKIVDFLLKNGAHVDEHCIALATEKKCLDITQQLKQAKKTEEILSDINSLLKQIDSKETERTTGLKIPEIVYIKEGAEEVPKEIPVAELISFHTEQKVVDLSEETVEEISLQDVQPFQNKPYLSTPTKPPVQPSPEFACQPQVPEPSSFSWGSMLVGATVVGCAAYVAKIAYQKWKMNQKQSA